MCACPTVSNSLQPHGLWKQVSMSSPCLRGVVCVLSHFSHVWLFATPWPVAHQAPPSMEFCRQEYWTGLPFPPPEDLPNPEIKPTSLTSPALPGGFFTWKVKSLNHVQLSATPWTVAHQAPPSMEFSRQEYWSGLPFPSPGDLPNPGIEPRSPVLWTDALPSEPPGNPFHLESPCNQQFYLAVLCT